MSSKKRGDFAKKRSFGARLKLLKTPCLDMGTRPSSTSSLSMSCSLAGSSGSREALGGTIGNAENDTKKKNVQALILKKITAKNSYVCLLQVDLSAAFCGRFCLFYI